MATLFVDKLDPQSGTTLEIGSSGDTVNLAGTVGTGFPANTPYFQAVMSTAAQTLSDNTAAKVAFNVATYDSGSTYDTTNYRWTPGVAGKYLISTSVYASADSDSEMQTTMCDLRKNGTIIYYIGNFDGRTSAYGRGKVCPGSVICELGASDYVEVFITLNTVSGGAARVNGESKQTWFSGFKLA